MINGNTQRTCAGVDCEELFPSQLTHADQSDCAIRDRVPFKAQSQPWSLPDTGRARRLLVTYYLAWQTSSEYLHMLIKTPLGFHGNHTWCITHR